jgi:hypothetical protein
MIWEGESLAALEEDLVPLLELDSLSLDDGDDRGSLPVEGSTLSSVAGESWGRRCRVARGLHVLLEWGRFPIVQGVDDQPDEGLTGWEAM